MFEHDTLPLCRVDEAIAELEGALERDPLAVMVRTWLGVMSWLNRQYDRAIEQARLVVGIEPASYIGYWMIGMFCRENGMFAESIAAHRTAVERSSGPRRHRQCIPLDAPRG